MPIEFSHTIDLALAPGAVFAVLADMSQTPSWLARCVRIDVLTPGPLQAGSQLRYHYRDGRRRGVMDGHVVERLENQKLVFRYDDKMMGCDNSFAMEPTSPAMAAPGTRLTHSITLSPKAFVTRLFSPLIRRALPKQTIAAMEKLRKLLEPALHETAR